MSTLFFQVDAFTSEPFSGDPAGVCLLREPRDDRSMQNVAREMNLSDTAFLQRSTDGFDLRWFTPSVEVDLCGHATLESAHILSCDESGEVVIVVRDPGAGFDPRAIADPLDFANIRKPSCRGIFLINELMDHVQFPHGGREIQMRKKKAPDLTPTSR